MENFTWTEKFVQGNKVNYISYIGHLDENGHLVIDWRTPDTELDTSPKDVSFSKTNKA